MMMMLNAAADGKVHATKQNSHKLHLKLLLFSLVFALNLNLKQTILQLFSDTFFSGFNCCSNL